MAEQNEFARLLEEGDVRGLMKAWLRVAPHLPQPENHHDATITMHYARTQAETVSLAARQYSHRWLIEHGFPSALPDALKPKPERVDGIIVSAVGVSVRALDQELQPVAAEIEKAMAAVVADCYANGDTEPALVQARMAEARSRVTRQLLGR